MIFLHQELGEEALSNWRERERGDGGISGEEMQEDSGKSVELEIEGFEGWRTQRQNEKVKKANERKVYLQLYEAMEALVRKCGSGFLTVSRDVEWFTSGGSHKLGCRVTRSVMNDQGLNVRLLSRKKLGVEIPRNKKDGSFTNEAKAESIKLAMVSEERDHLRRNVRKMKGLFGDKNKG
ncbi:hypothetical protein Tco_1499554 [Tanacetum coccineum]